VIETGGNRVFEAGAPAAEYAAMVVWGTSLHFVPAAFRVRAKSNW